MKKYLNTIRWYIVATIVLSILEAVITAAMLLFPGILIDNYHMGVAFIGKLIATYVGSFLLYLIVAYLANRLADFRRIKFEKSIKKDFFNSVIRRDYKAFHEYDSAEYISMQANEITEMCQNYLSPLLSVFRSLIMLVIFGVSLVLFVDPYIAALILVFSVVIVFVPNITGEGLSTRNKEFLDCVGHYTSTVKKFYDAHDILDLKSMDKISSLHELKLNQVLNKNMFFRRLNSLAMVLNGGSVEAIAVVTFALVAFLLINNRITLGMATIAFTYSTKFIDPMYEMNVCLGLVNSTKKIRNKILTIINKTDPREKLAHEICKISATSLVKKYEETKIQIPPIQMVFPKKYLILGENGTGKSVFFRLLMGFEKPDEGCVNYDGVGEIDTSASICYVPQMPIIFDADYEDNVTLYHTYDNSKLKEYEEYFPQTIIESIKSSIDPQNLSGGEKQVIAILRALCSNKRVILLDEPFAAMNSSTIDAFLKKMRSLERMVVIIAHNVDSYFDLFDEHIIIRR